MDDVDVATIPTRFIQSLTVKFSTGDEMHLGSDDLLNLESIEDVISELDANENLSDLKVILDFDAIENEVKAVVSDIFDRIQKRHD